MTKRLVDIDDDLLEAAQSALGTHGIKDTICEALSTVTSGSDDRLDEIRRAFAAIASVPLTDSDRESAWR